MTAFDDMKTTVEAVKAGAFEYLVKPLDFLELDLTIDKALQVRALEDKVSYLVEEKQKEYTIDNLVGRSPQMREVFKLIGSVATPGPTSSSRARAAPARSSWPRPSITTARSATSRSSSSTARPSRTRSSRASSSATPGGPSRTPSRETRGKFEIAGRGTLFLDEIGDVSPNLQSKLLRVIETRDFMKVGGEKVLKTEARIVAATNQNLTALIEKGRFREDLYYRLKVVEIVLPPLRERKDDIPALAAYLLEKINRELRKNVRKVPEDVMKLLTDMPWKGNVRELENALTRAVILAKGDVVLKENLPLETPGEEALPAGARPAQRGREELYPARPRRDPGEQDPDEPDPPDQPPDPRQEDQGIRTPPAGRSAGRPGPGPAGSLTISPVCANVWGHEEGPALADSPLPRAYRRPSGGGHPVRAPRLRHNQERHPGGRPRGHGRSRRRVLFRRHHHPR